MRNSLYDSVMADLEATKFRWPQVAAATGVSIRTIRKIANREIKDPGVSHIEKLAAYFEQKREAAA
jgi:transcriptional regulator with XRE-family HTH domain